MTRTRILRCVFSSNKDSLLHNGIITITTRKLTLTPSCSLDFSYHNVAFSCSVFLVSFMLEHFFRLSLALTLASWYVLTFKTPANYFPKYLYHFTTLSGLYEAFVLHNLTYNTSTWFSQLF